MNCNLQPVFACIIIAVLCVLSAMQVLSQCCTLSPSKASEWGCVVVTVALFGLVFVYLCKRTVNASGTKDSFADYAHNWGSTDDTDFAEFDSEHTTRITGPIAGADLNTWQYNPQNTLVDYAFYESPANGDKPVRLSPLANGSVGKRDHPPDHLSGQGVCNSNPAKQTYAVKNPASVAPVPTGTVGWSEQANV
jgi:hypothetical protein